MSADHLPEDLGRWPRDPYRILGVPVRCAPQEARRAYTRLIRRFKPEQFPEHFRRIREAYETIQRFGDMHYLFDPAGVDPEMSNAAAADLESFEGDAAGEAAGFEMPGLDLPVSKSHDPDLETLWDKACDGQEQEAYDGLVRLYEQALRDSELPVRLYSLLLANPALDARRQACDWLACGLRDQGLWGPCRELYRREIEDNPREALGERFLSLLDSPARPQSMTDLVAWRWQALFELGQTEVIASDLELLAPRIEKEDEEAWVHLLLLATDYLAWYRQSPGRILFDKLCQEIDGHVHLHARLGEALSRLDFLRELAEAWRVLSRERSANRQFLDIVPVSWVRPYDNQHRFLPYFRRLAWDPLAALEMLDAVQAEAPVLVAHLVNTFAWQWNHAADPRGDVSLRQAVSAFLAEVHEATSDVDYHYYRRHLLRLCTTEVIAPETVADLLDPRQVTLVGQKILDDWPLRLVCLAHRVTWV